MRLVVSAVHCKRCIVRLSYWSNLGCSWEKDAFLLTSICPVNIELFELLLWASVWHKYPEPSSLTVGRVWGGKAGCRDPAFIENRWQWVGRHREALADIGKNVKAVCRCDIVLFGGHSWCESVVRCECIAVLTGYFCNTFNQCFKWKEINAVTPLIQLCMTAQHVI